LGTRLPGAEASFRREGAGGRADGISLTKRAPDQDGVSEGVAPDCAAQDGLGIDGDDEAVGLPLDAHTLVGDGGGRHISLLSKRASPGESATDVR
jgi:hypothetical protein